VLIDTHFVIRTPEGFWPGLPIDVLREIKPTHIVMIRAPVQAIVFRRQQDKARKRDFESRGADRAGVRTFKAVHGCSVSRNRSPDESN